MFSFQNKEWILPEPRKNHPKHGIFPKHASYLFSICKSHNKLCPCSRKSIFHSLQQDVSSASDTLSLLDPGFCASISAFHILSKSIMELFPLTLIYKPFEKHIHPYLFSLFPKEKKAPTNDIASDVVSQRSLSNELSLWEFSSLLFPQHKRA